VIFVIQQFERFADTGVSINLILRDATTLDWAHDLQKHAKYYDNHDFRIFQQL